MFQQHLYFKVMIYGLASWLSSNSETKTPKIKYHHHPKSHALEQTVLFFTQAEKIAAHFEHKQHPQASIVSSIVLCGGSTVWLMKFSSGLIRGQT